MILWLKTAVKMANVSDPCLFLQQKPGMVPPPPGEESQTVILPPGWHSYLSPQGRRYYVNTTTNGKSCSGAAFSKPQDVCLSLGVLFSLHFHLWLGGLFLAKFDPRKGNLAS